MIAKDVHTKQCISYQFVQSESNASYKVLKQMIEAKGFTIKAVVIDGRRGLFGLFQGIPVQMCHFHQQAIMTRYLTRNPKLPASIDLKRIASFLGDISLERFKCLLRAWEKRYENFLEEKTYNDETKRWHYTHRRVRSAFRSLKTNLPYLFSYKNHPELDIPNTTNSLDGGLFAPMKMLMKIHRGLSLKMRKKLIVDYLENQGK